MSQNLPDLFLVVMNSEEQYSIISQALDVPEGWQLVGFDGPIESCVDYVNRHWLDMRPRSLRQALDSRPG